MRASSRPSSTAAAVAATLSICSSPLYAQSQSEKALDAVVVTATRTPTRVSELTSDITVLDQEQLQKSSSLVQALRSVPGVEFVQTGGPGTAATVFLRGSNDEHTLVLIDGVRIGSASLGTTALQHIPIDQIERVEILRGPASSMYGAAAIGGVIQIFTRSGQGNPGFNASASYGSYGTTTLSAGNGYEKDGLRFAIQLGAIESYGLTAIRNPRSTSFNPDADGYRNLNFSASLSKKFDAGHEVGLRTFYTDGIVHIDTTPVPAFDHRTYATQDSNSIYGRLRLNDYWSSQLTAGTSTDDSTTMSAPTVRAVIRTIQEQYNWQNDIRLPVGSLMLGMESVEQRVNGSTLFPVTSRKVDSVIAAYQAGLGRHHIQVSSRQDHYDRLGDHNTGYAGYGFDITSRLRLTAGAGTAFKAPTFNQLYFPGFGNPNLAPESARNAEFGVRYASGGFQFGVVHFENRIKDLIVNVGTPLRPVNIGQAKISGTTFSMSTDARGTQISANLNLQDPKDGASGLFLPRRAQRFGTVSASRPMFGGNLGVEMFASSARYSDAANLLRLGGYTLFSAYYETPLSQKGWTAFLRGENLTDKLYSLAQDFNVPGRSLFVGVRYAPGR